MGGGSMWRKFGAALAVALVLALGLVVLAPTVERAEALACISSLTCQPANIPLIVESGVVVAPKVVGTVGTATVGVVAKGSSGFLWGKLKPLINGFLTVTTLIDLFDGEQSTQGGISTDGVIGQRIQTAEGLATALNFDGTKSCFKPTGGTSEFCATVEERSATGWCVRGSWSGSSNGQMFTRMSFTGTPSSQVADFTSAGSAECPAVVGLLTALIRTVWSAGQPLPLESWRVARSGSWGGGEGAAAVGVPGPGVVSGKALVTLTCQGAGGALRVVTSSLVQSFVAGQLLVVPDTTCAPGELAVGADIDWDPDAGATVRVVEDDGTQVLPQQKELPMLYPDCFTGTGIGCVMTLEKLLGAEVETCGKIGELCEDWASDPQRETHYRCRYGQTVITLDHCSAYRRPSVGVLPNVDLNGNLLSPSAPVPNIQKPGTATGPGTAAPPDAEDAPCRPSSWIEALNPYWAFRAVQCALHDAFVPRAAVIRATVEEASAAWDNTMPRKLAVIMQSWEFGTVAPTGCNGITVDVWFLGPPFQIMQACPGDALESMASWSRIFGNLLFGVYGVLAIVRHIAKIIGFEGLGQGRELE